MKKIKKLWFGLFLAVAFTAVWLKLVDLQQVSRFLGEVKLSYIWPVLGLSALNSLVVSRRWQLLMRPLGRAPLSFFWGVNLVSRLPALLIPFRGGGLLQAYLVKKRFKKPYSTCFSVLWVDFLLSVSLFFFFSFQAFFFLIGRIDRLAFYAFWVSLSFGLLLSMVLKGSWWAAWVGRVVKKLPDNFGLKKRIFSASENLGRGFALLEKNRGLLLKAWLISLIAFVLGGARTLFLLLAFGVKVSFFKLLLAQAVLGLSGLLPGTPAMLGQFELFGLLVYQLFLDLNQDLIAAMVLLSHLLSVSFTLSAGFLASFFFPPRFDQAKKPAELLALKD